MRRDGDIAGDDPAAHEPLIAGQESTPAHGDHLQGTAEPRAPPQQSIVNAGPVVRFLTLSAGISGLLFGFDTGVISSTLVSIGSDLSHRTLTTTDKSFITAVTSLLALVCAPTTGYFADRHGRKSVILIPALLFVVGALIQAFAGEVWVMVVGRALVGAAVGVASGAVPLYITELAPAALRGRLVTVQALFVTGGQVVAYLIGWLFASFPHGWRWMVGVGALPALLQLVLIIWMPETPRWLLQAGRDEEARRVLQKVYAGLPSDLRGQVIQGVLMNVQSEINAQDKVLHGDERSSRSAFHEALHELLTIPGNRRSLIIACMLQGIQQLCGFNSLMYFSATIFALVGFTSPIGTSLSIALTNFLFTLVAFSLIDSIGRRTILLRSIPFMFLGLFACAISFSFLHIPGADRPSSPSATTPPQPPSSSFWSIILLTSMILYVAAYAIGLGCVPWQQSELFPLRVRSLGSGLATASNWSSNFLIGMSFLPMMNLLGPSSTFALYAIVCVVGWIAIWRIYPETAGLELEGVGELLKSGWGVQESVRSFRERRKEVSGGVM